MKCNNTVRPIYTPIKKLTQTVRDVRTHTQQGRDPEGSAQETHTNGTWRPNAHTTGPGPRGFCSSTTNSWTPPDSNSSPTRQPPTPSCFGRHLQPRPPRACLHLPAHMVTPTILTIFRSASNWRLLPAAYYDTNFGVQMFVANQRRPSQASANTISVI